MPRSLIQSDLSLFGVDEMVRCTILIGSGGAGSLNIVRNQEPGRMLAQTREQTVMVPSVRQGISEVRAVRTPPTCPHRPRSPGEGLSYRFNPLRIDGYGPAERQRTSRTTIIFIH